MSTSFPIDSDEAVRQRYTLLVPSLDGGFSCLALREPVPGLARAFRYGDASSLESVWRFAWAAGLSSVLLEPWPDVDSRADVFALLRRGRRWPPPRAGAARWGRR